MTYRLPFRLGLVYGTLAVVRRLSRRSGVTDEEFYGPLPGDDVMAHPMLEWTRATTINAPPEKVWPWLVQMGYGRGGWYTNERFDRIVWRIENKSADTILPDWQHLAVGDIIPDGPDFAAYFRVREVREHEAIVYHSIRHPYRGQPVDPNDPTALQRRESELIAGGRYIDFSWAFALRPVGDHATRLLIRARADLSPRWVRVTETAFGLVDLFHVTVMFDGIRRRAEGWSR
jgi:proline iminopeptidase